MIFLKEFKNILRFVTRALSCIKRKLVSSAACIVSESGSCRRSSMRENSPSYKMSSYSCAAIPPSSQMINGPSLSPVKHAQTITLTCALLNVFLTYFRLSLSPGGRMTHWRHGFTPIHILDLSDQITFFQSSIVQSLYFSGQANRFAILLAVKPGLLAAI